MEFNLTSSIRVVKINLMRSSNALQELLIYPKENEVDIALGSEPLTYKNVMINIKNVFIIQSKSERCLSKCSILIFNKHLEIDL